LLITKNRFGPGHFFINHIAFTICFEESEYEEKEAGCAKKEQHKKLRWRKLAAIESSAPCKNTKKSLQACLYSHMRQGMRKEEKRCKKN